MSESNERSGNEKGFDALGVRVTYTYEPGPQRPARRPRPSAEGTAAPVSVERACRGIWTYVYDPDGTLRPIRPPDPDPQG